MQYTWLIVLAAIIAFLIIIGIYVKWKSGWCTSYACLVGKTAIVTGSNTGIGYWTALDLAKRGCRVILACRNKQKAEAARIKIVEETGNTNVYVRIIDMESLNSVKNFAKEFNETEERLDILVNNAGGVYFGEKFTEDNLHITMQVNHFSNVLLTELLLDKLKKSAPSRIINVASEAALGAVFMSAEDINKIPRGIFRETRAYAMSKLCNILFTIELAKNLEGTRVTANTLHPGVIRTDFGRNMTYIIRKFLFDFVALAYFKTSEEGAQTTLHLCVAKEVENVTGGLFKNCKQVGLYFTAKYPRNLSKEVWHKSRELVGLS